MYAYIFYASINFYTHVLRMDILYEPYLKLNHKMSQLCLTSQLFLTTQIFFTYVCISI